VRAPQTTSSTAAGSRIHASDLVLPTGAELLTDAAILIVNITQAISEEALEAELEADLAELGVVTPAAEAAAVEAVAEEAAADAAEAEGDKA